MRSDVAQQTKLEDVQVIASCSHDTAAAVAGLPAEGQNWAFLSSGTWSLMGVELDAPDCVVAPLDELAGVEDEALVLDEPPHPASASTASVDPMASMRVIALPPLCVVI